MTSPEYNRVHVLIMGNIHTKYELDPIRHGRLSLFTGKNIKISQMSISYQKRPWICTKNNRVPVVNVRNTRTKFKLDPTRQSGLKVFTSKASHTHIHIHTYIHIHIRRVDCIDSL